jgi:hypothetical protein
VIDSASRKIRSEEERKMGKKHMNTVREKSQAKSLNPEGQIEDSGLHFHSKSQQIHHENLRVF